MVIFGNGGTKYTLLFTQILQMSCFVNLYEKKVG